MEKVKLLSSLYEISLSIGTSLDLDTLLDESVSVYIRQLNCSGAIVIQANENNSELKYTYVRPKVFYKDNELLNQIKQMISDECIKCYEHGFAITKYKDYFIYLSKLDGYGYFALIKYDEDFQEYLLFALSSLNTKLSNAILACISNQKLRLNERTMHQQSKMAAMGEMMSNIAHQWRQPLQVIGITTQKLQLNHMINGTVNDDELNNMVDTVSSQLDYLTQTIDDFRNFFKPDKQTKKFQISSIITKTLSLVNASIYQNDITVLSDNIHTECLIESLENELIQVLINIIKNAIDILCEKKEKIKLITISAQQQNDYVIIEITDNGGGINENIKNKIFEPYFTTKHQSRGTGLGLYMSYEIVTKHLNGYLAVDNKEFSIEPNSYFGANFTIVLPLNINSTNK